MHASSPVIAQVPAVAEKAAVADESAIADEAAVGSNFRTDTDTDVASDPTASQKRRLARLIWDGLLLNRCRTWGLHG